MTNNIKNSIICAIVILASSTAITSFVLASQVAGTLSSGSSSGSSISGNTGGSSVAGTIGGGSSGGNISGVVGGSTGGGGNGPVAGSLATGASGGGNGPIVGSVSGGNGVTTSNSRPSTISFVSPSVTVAGNTTQPTGGVALVNAPQVASNTQNANANQSQLASVVNSGIYLGAWYWWVLILLLLGVLGLYQYARYRNKKYKKQ